MGRYSKTMMIIVVFIFAIAAVGFKSTIDNSVAVLQKSLDMKSKDSANLIALSLNGVDIESEIELVESLIKGAYNLGSFEEVTLYGKPTGDSQNLRMQNKKDMSESALKSSFFELVSKESIADITLDGEVQGKVLVKGDASQAFIAMEASVVSVMKLFLILAFGSIFILGVIVNMILKAPKNS